MERSLETRIREHISGAQVQVTGDGNRFEIEVTSAAFDGLNRVQRQQLVYEAIADFIRDGSVHAVTIRALTAGS